MRNLIAAYKNWRHWYSLAYEDDDKYRGFLRFVYKTGLSWSILYALLDHEAYGTPIPEYANVSFPGDDITEIGINEELAIT